MYKEKCVNHRELAYKGNIEKKGRLSKSFKYFKSVTADHSTRHGALLSTGPCMTAHVRHPWSWIFFSFKSYDLVGERNKNRSNYMQIIFNTYNEMQTLEKVALWKT